MSFRSQIVRYCAEWKRARSFTIDSRDVIVGFESKGDSDAVGPPMNNCTYVQVTLAGRFSDLGLGVLAQPQSLRSMCLVRILSHELFQFVLMIP